MKFRPDKFYARRGKNFPKGLPYAGQSVRVPGRHADRGPVHLLLLRPHVRQQHRSGTQQSTCQPLGGEDEAEEDAQRSSADILSRTRGQMTAAKAIEAKIVAGGLKFDPGRVVMTPGAIELLANNNALVSEYLVRHITGDWGYMKLDPHDNRANESALKTGARILSAYEFDAHQGQVLDYHRRG